MRLIEVDGADHGLAPQEKYRISFEEAIIAVEEFAGIEIYLKGDN